MDTTLEELRELQDRLDTSEQERKQEKQELETRLAAFEKILKNHGHEGQTEDGSKRLQRDIDLLQGNSVGVGGVGSLTGLTEKTSVSERTIVAIVTGNDTSPEDGSNNSQLYMEHQYQTDGSTNQTFFQGIRSPVYVGTTASITSAGTSMTQNDYDWVPNSLVGAWITVNNATGSSFQCYPISANTSRTVTISGGTWGFSGVALSYTVFIPIYLGSATFPWRRIYTMDGTAGGLRIGPGPTNGGQNGLLYMDSAGDLYWRNTSGSSTKLN
jgi:hypothetical protein